VTGTRLSPALPVGSPDPYQTLGVKPDVSDDELHHAYRRMVQLHHPDHNHGSPESARRFEEIQAAYSEIKALRASADRPGPPPRTAAAVDPEAEARLADIERQVREAHLARERALQAAREAAARTERRPSDEELGYVTTDDSFGKLLADARTELSERFAEARTHPATRRLTDLIDELASKLGGEANDGSGKDR
jgi:curved DNA-binding protein CbpA